ncbi:MAG: hypothetical protein J6P33_06610, partial [Spirochaetales bacterium]|nr:hypothetical protein [Spirochaetales bacterium]
DAQTGSHPVQSLTASAASARFCYPACGLPGSGWPLHRLRTACAQSHFRALTTITAFLLIPVVAMG